MLKVSPKTFPLASSAMRLALIGGMLEGMVSAEEVKHHMVLDAEKRPHRKPVVAAGMWFPSVAAAARYLSTSDTHAEVSNLAKMISRKCNEDCWEGFYWSE